MIRLLHFSDIHFKHPECLDLDTDPNTSIRDKLSSDIQEHCSKDGKNVDAILITGDIAFAGKQEEYEVAANWIDDLCSQTGCRKQNVYVVPGNHDVDRQAADGVVVDALRRQLSEIKSKTDRDSQFCKFLSDTSAGNSILHPMQNYNTFAARYDCGISPENTHWNQKIKISEDIELNLRGITTTLFSSSKDNTGKLIVDRRQTSFRQEPGQIYLSMMHHPCDWLIDSDDIKDQLDNHIQIQLFGHKHRSRWDSSDNCIRVSAISLHPDRGEAGYEPGYNIMDLKQKTIKDNKALIDVKVIVRVLQSSPMQFISKRFGDNDFILKTFSVTKSFKSKASDFKASQEIDSSFPPQDVDDILKDITDLKKIEPKATLNLKELSYSFYKLSGSDKRDILNTLDLLTNDEWELPEVERQKVAFNRAVDNNSLQLIHDSIIKKVK
ncbi:calcineurin-like phosphoesterase (plasmid) [Aliivibrio salmonicida LFI1238]|uniref:Calcineurin-like phosphoesterase n=1 Tax=Aliivibrio salmonicida (strain LFI1238) TaxID=316275 RepID=B6ET35_ALISL|nr:metallophosphoesterase [Aliivibrio salmonicida]CAQ81923.1 calcineurin-like phosphoesterase [Aliivibrio salmonicida LFI1238]